MVKRVESGGDALADGLAALADSLEGAVNGNAPRILTGATLPFREWVRTVERDFDLDGLSPEHQRLIEWADALEPGVKPPAFLADWPRGYGKTTWMRLVALRLCVTKARTFVLIVSALQDSANRSVQALRKYFEQRGIERMEDRYGSSLGWSAATLRTKCGFTVVAVGLDVASVRGINVQGQRPDFIAPDDIDKLGESPEVTEKNYNTLTQTILGAGTDDTAVLFVQNEIHANSVMHRLISHEADALRRRITSKTVAVEGLEIGSRPNPEPGEPDIWVITKGRSTWPARPLSYWEGLLNDTGPLAFRREMQHELGAGGLFFNFYATRPDTATGELLPWHECDMPRILPHWLIQAGGDYGTASHHAQVIGALDEYGVLYIIGEEGEPNRTDKQQALALLIRLEELGLATGILPSGVHPGIGKRDRSVAGTIVSLDRDGYEVPQHHRLSAFALDPAGTMPPEGNSAQTAQERMSEYPVEVFRRYGIPVVRAQKNIVAGLGGLREAMFRTVTYPQNHPTEPGRQVPMLRIVRGQAPMTQRYLETAVKDPKDELRAVSAAKLEHCLTADALVTTRRGDVPICDVTDSDEVLTRKGWRKVARAWLTAKDAEVYKVRFSDGRSITGTSGHPIYIHGRGFVTIDAIRYGDGIIDVCQIAQMWSEKPSNWTASPIVGIQTRLSSRIKATTAALLKTLSRDYPATITETCGLRLTGLSPMGGISTTKTATLAITRSTIWSACPQPSTEGFTLLRPILRSGRRCKQDSLKCRSWLKRGTQAPPVKNGTVSTRLNPVSVNGSLSKRSVSSVALSFWINQCTVASSALTTASQLTAEQAVRTSWRSRARSVARSLATIATLKRCAAPRNARGSYVVSVEPASKADVYNLTVEGEPEFFANGVLVHNCGDALRYLRQRAIEAVDPNAPKAVVLKDGTVLPPDTAQWYKDVMQPYAQQPPTNIGVSSYRGTAGRGR